MVPPCFNLSNGDCQVTRTLAAKFADDNTPCNGGKHDVDSVNQAIGHIMEWCESNYLILNNEKSKEVQIKLSHSVTFQPVHDIEITDKLKILGITFTDKLSFEPHITKATKKASSQLFLLVKLKNLGYTKIELNHLYNQLVMPILLYGIQVWGGGGAPQYLLDKLKAESRGGLLMQALFKGLSQSTTW